MKEEKKIIGLLRCSTRKQLQGNSLQDQEKQIRRYAEKLNATIIDFVKLQVSGSKMRVNAGVLMKTLSQARGCGASLMGLRWIGSLEMQPHFMCYANKLKKQALMFWLRGLSRVSVKWTQSRLVC